MTLPGLVKANNLEDVVDREKVWDNLGSSLATGDIPIPGPSLDLNFAANKSLVDDISGNNLITFSRASSGTFVGSNGLIQSAASGVPRFDHNPLTGESLGLLVEESRTNLITYSQSSLGWIHGGVSGNADISPDGTASATLVTGAASARGTLGSGTFNYSFFVKQGTSSTFRLIWAGYGIPADWTFTFSTKSLAVAGNWYNASVVSYPNGWYRISATTSSRDNYYYLLLADSASSTFYVWGEQGEVGAFPTSYIPTEASTVTRAADLASITGANFSSWYRQSEGTMFVNFNTPAKANSIALQVLSIRNSTPTEFIEFYTGNNSTDGITLNVAAGRQFAFYTRNTVDIGKYALALKANNFAVSKNGLTPLTDTNGSMTSLVDRLFIGTTAGGNQLNGTFSRLTYWPARLRNEALQYLTQPLVTSINLYAFNYAINGKDVLALNSVRNASTRSFIFIKGLLSAAQPRLTAAAASTTSALALATNALPKLSPISSANYFFTAGITLSGVTTRVNGTNALSIATSPFSGSTAIAPLLFSELRPQANWRFTEPMPSGTIASPELAIPFETNDFVFFMKAGQN